MSDTVTFYIHPGAWRFDAAGRYDPGSRYNVIGHWIAQTAGHLASDEGRRLLAERDLEVVVSPALPTRGVVVAARDSLPEAEPAWHGPGLFVVCVEADRAGLRGYAQRWADLRIVHNPADPSVDGERAVALLPWVQEGLIPRDPTRGDCFERVVYPGIVKNNLAAPPAGTWAEWFAARGLAFEVRGPGRWHDYSDVDLVFAVRSWDGGRYYHKPANKLLNAWAAGVPAVLGDESAYWEIGTHGADCELVGGVEPLARIMEYLRHHPEHRRKVAHLGRAALGDYNEGETLRRWADVLAQARGAWRG